MNDSGTSAVGAGRAIDWRAVQRALRAAGLAPGAIDGVAGALTFAALFAFAAGRGGDAVIAALGRAAAALLPGAGCAATPARLAEFLGQTAHETGGYTRFVERLDYTAEGLCRTWPARFPTLAAARAIAGDARAIAEVCYGGRMGNARPGDGWRYRGRGLVQLTGRANYAAYGAMLGLPLLDEPDLAADPATGLRVAVAYWARAGVDAAVDDGDYAGARRITNAGGRHARDRSGALIRPIGLAEVGQRRARLLGLLGPADARAAA